MPSARTDEVVGAAVSLVEAEGVDALGWNRVAKELGMKPPSLYNHVDNASDLRRRVAIRGWAVIGDAIVRAAEGATGSAEQKLYAILRAYRDAAMTHPALFEIATGTRLHPDDPDFRAVAAPQLALFVAPLGELGIPPDQQVHAIRALRAATHGFLELERHRVLAMDPSLDESFEVLMRALLSGLRSVYAARA